MEHTAAWGAPFEFQLAATNWTAEEEPAGDTQAWAAHAAGHPLEYASIVDIFGPSCSLQPYVVPASSSGGGGSSGGQQQLVEYNYYNYSAAAAQHHDPDPVQKYINSPERMFQDTRKKFWKDAELMKTKMPRYPPSIQTLGDWCTVPKVVAIGPYFHRRDHLQEAEEMKHVAAQYCIEGYNAVNNNSGLSVQDMYAAVHSIAKEIYDHGLYNKDAMEGMGFEDEFLPMMFYDACFLVIYMLRKSAKHEFDQYLFGFFESNHNDIAHDIMLLENQIPLQVVDAVMNKCTADPLQEKKDFIDMWRKDGFLQDRAVRELPGVDHDQRYYNEAPHLLGLLRFYAVGERKSTERHDKIKSITTSAGAIELAEIGISLAPSGTTKLTDMGLANRCIFLAELSMAPLSLNDRRASWLVNMAALELCTTPDFFDAEGGAGYQDSAVCSYLLLLCMLMHREEDVHELRNQGILQGAGLTNQKTLDFFTSLQCLREGPCYADVMVDIQKYKNRRPRMTKVYAFVYHNWKYIVAVGTAISGFIGVITALIRHKGSH